MFAIPFEEKVDRLLAFDSQTLLYNRNQDPSIQPLLDHLGDVWEHLCIRRYSLFVLSFESAEIAFRGAYHYEQAMLLKDTDQTGYEQALQLAIDSHSLQAHLEHLKTVCQAKNFPKALEFAQILQEEFGAIGYFFVADIHHNIAKQDYFTRAKVDALLKAEVAYRCCYELTANEQQSAPYADARKSLKNGIGFFSFDEEALTATLAEFDTLREQKGWPAKTAEEQASITHQVNEALQQVLAKYSDPNHEFCNSVDFSFMNRSLL